MTRTRVILLAVLLVLVAGLVIEQRMRSGSGVSDAKAAVETDATAGHGNRSGGRQGGGERGQGPIAVQTAVAQTRDIPITEHAVGWVEPIASVAIRPRIDGVILQKAVADGATVKTGDLLFKLDDRAIQAMLAKDRATLAKDQASSAQLQADLTRLKTLHGHNDASEQQVEQQQATLNQATASIAGDAAQISADQVQIDYTTITAPIDGRIGTIGPTVGALVHTTDANPLLTITDMAPLRVSFNVPQRDLDAFRAALAASPPATVRVADADSGKVLSSGQLSFIDSSVDTSSGTVTARADFLNADGALWPGEYVRVEAELGVRRDATIVPLAAVQLNEKGSYVFLAKPDGTVATQTVTVADESGDNAVIGSGLQPNDHVVVEGQLRLHDGSPIKETVAAATPDNGKPADGATAEAATTSATP